MAARDTKRRVSETDISKRADEIGNAISSIESILAASRRKAKKSGAAAAKLPIDARHVETAIDKMRVNLASAASSAPHGYDMADKTIREARRQQKQAMRGDLDALIAACYNAIEAAKDIDAASYAMASRDFEQLRELSVAAKELARDLDAYIESSEKMASDMPTIIDIRKNLDKTKKDIDKLMP